VNRPAAWLVILFLSCGAATAWAGDSLQPTPDKGRIRRPDHELKELKGERAGRREALEEKSKALDRRMALREEARLEALAERMGSGKPALWGFSVSLSLDASFFSGVMVKGPVSSPGHVNLRDDLSLPSVSLAPLLGMELGLRRQSGVFLGASYRSVSGRERVGGDGFTYHGRTFVAGERIQALWESIYVDGGVYYVFSPDPNAYIRAEMGTVYLRTFLALNDGLATTGRIVESNDTFYPFLALAGRFALSASVWFTPRLSLGFLWFGNDKYSQNNFALDARLGLTIPLDEGWDLLLGYHIWYGFPAREDRGWAEESRLLLHGLVMGLTVRFL
jgi:hypothetical protein